jgi:transposase
MLVSTNSMRGHMDTSGSKAAVASQPKRGWRRHSDEFKARVIELARQPHTSVAAVALANGLNANMLRRWVRDSEMSEVANGDHPRPTFVQLPMPAASLSAADSPQDLQRLEVEIHRNGMTVRASLPLDSRSAAWLREVTG